MKKYSLLRHCYNDFVTPISRIFVQYANSWLLLVSVAILWSYKSMNFIIFNLEVLLGIIIFFFYDSLKGRQSWTYITAQTWLTLQYYFKAPLSEQNIHLQFKLHYFCSFYSCGNLLHPLSSAVIIVFLVCPIWLPLFHYFMCLNDPGLCDAGIDPGMALTPFSCSIRKRRYSNPRPFDWKHVR